MIYLIGGPPKCGKTTLARELFNKTKIPWMAVDTLQSLVWPYLSDDDRKKRMPASVITVRTKRSNDLKYKMYAVKDIMNAYREQARNMFAVIDMMVLGEITDGKSHILEGYQIEPRLAHKLIKRYGKENVRAVFLTKKNQKDFFIGMKKSKTYNDWVLGRTKKEETLYKIAEMVSLYSKIIEKEARDYKMVNFLMDKDFAGKIKKIIRHLIS